VLNVEHNGPIATVTINRPEVRNAFNDVLIARLTETFQNLPAETRAVVLAGEGKAFCAGGDLDWMRKAASYTEEENFQDALKLANLFQTIATCKAVTIAKVHGPAFGGGCGLVAACDVALAAPEALFCFSEVRIGLIPATISKFVIPKIGLGHSRALFATGDAFSAEHALRIGLVHEVGNLDELVTAKLKQILSVGPEASYKAKQLVFDYPLTMEEGARRLAECRATEEGKEGVASFLERRKASYVVEP
jgi:methylglutaconyl-CoA hydratase